MLARWTPFQGFFELQRDLMNLFDRAFGNLMGTEQGSFIPRCEAYYKDGQLHVRAELAGVDPKSVDVSLVGQTLTIKGERRAVQVPADDRWLSEIPYGTFERTLTVPEGLDAENIKARWHQGILEITIPVSQALRPRKVPIEVVTA